MAYTESSTGPSSTTPARAWMVDTLKLFSKSIKLTRAGGVLALHIYALQIFRLSRPCRSHELFQVSPLAEMGDRWHDPGVIALGPVLLGRRVEPVSGPPPADPPTLTSAEKWQRWHDLGRCLPFLQVEPGGLVGEIAYAGRPLFEYTANLFWRRVRYGLWLDGDFQPLLDVGGSGPWVAVQPLNISPRCPWGQELRFDRDDRADDAPVIYRTAAEKQAHTARFWQQVDGVTWRVRGLAWREMVQQIRARQLWPALAAARLVAGATWWLNRHWLPLRGRHGAAIQRVDAFLHRQLVALERGGNASAPGGEGARCASPV